MGIPVGFLVEFLVGKPFPPVQCPGLPMCCPSLSPRCLLGSPVTMTGRMLALRSSWITGADSGFRTFFITRNPRKFRPLSTESLVGDKEPFITSNTSTEDQGAETAKIHQGISQELPPYGLRLNFLQGIPGNEIGRQALTWGAAVPPQRWPQSPGLCRPEPGPGSHQWCSGGASGRNPGALEKRGQNSS